MTDQAATFADASCPPRSRAWWNAVNAWLLLLPAAVLLVAFTHYPILATIRHTFFLTPQRHGGVRRPRQLPVDDAGPDFLEGAGQQFLVRAGHHSDDASRSALLMALWVNREHARPRLPAPGILHADGVADDRGGQYLAVLLHAGLRPARSVARPVRSRRLQLARHRRPP